jgi:hypothetical protein
MHPVTEVVSTPPSVEAPSIDNEPSPIEAGRQAPAATIDAAGFGIYPDGRDCTGGLRAALDHCRAVGARKLIFARGRYVFAPDKAADEYVFISNNDDGLRRIAFLLKDFANLEIDGGGSDFIFRGLIIPFLIAHSSNVLLHNLSIDWDVPFHCEGKVISCDDAGMELEIPAQFPYAVVNGRFQSLGPSLNGWNLHHLLEFDPVRRETAYGAADYFHASDRFRVEEIAPRRVRIFGQFGSPRPQCGNVMLMSDSRRMCPGVFVTDSEGIALSELFIFHAGAMGVIVQRSSNLLLTRVRVMPRPGSDRVISVTADATHFVSCRGRIELSDCLFQTQVDDATNVHGIYQRIERDPDARSVVVQLVHRQQFGTNPIAPGHRVQFVSRKTLAPIYEARVLDVRRLNDEYALVSFAEELPPSVQQDDVVLDLFWQPAETLIRRCSVTGNRARGFLLSAGGRVLVEGCKFHTPGAAILLEGDANFWFESGPVNNVTIRDNDFDNCNYGPWGRAAIQISPGIESPFHREPRYHRNIRIEGNRFSVFFPTLLDAQDTDGLVFLDNQVTLSDTYPPREPEAPPLVIQNCTNVETAM